MIRHAHAERQALCQTLLDSGPDEPTLCGTWTTGDLTAHLVVREGRPDLAAGVVVPVLAPRAERAMARLRERHSHTDLVEQLRQGPPRWHPTRLPVVDEQANLVEMFVHHEDVLRAHLGAPRRSLAHDLVSTLGDRLPVLAPLLFRRAKGVDLEVVTAKGRRRVGRGADGHGPVVQIHGRPSEILLFGFGRQSVAEVELIGPPESVEHVRTTNFGL